MSIDITHANVVFYNPLPETTEAEIFALAEITSYGSDRKVFVVEHTYSPGSKDSLQVIWNPQHKLGVRYELADVIENMVKEDGVVRIDEKASEDTLLSASIRGLETARLLYDEFGDRKLDAYRDNNQFDQEQMRRKARELRPYYINSAKVKAIDAEISRLMDVRASKKTKVKTVTV